MKVKRLKEINDDNKFYFQGNGIFAEPVVGCFFYVDENEDCEKQCIPIEEAFVSFINIAEFINPLVFTSRAEQEKKRVKIRIYEDGRIWRDTYTPDPIDFLRASGVQRSRKVDLELISEVSNFVDSYGFIHKRKRNDTLTPHDRLTSNKRLKFIEEIIKTKDMEEVRRRLNEEYQRIDNLINSDLPLGDKTGLINRREELRKATNSSYYMEEELVEYVKCYKKIAIYNSRHLEEAEQFKILHDKLENDLDAIRNKEGDEHFAIFDKYNKELKKIHPDNYEDVERACQEASIMMQPYLETIKKYGLLELENPWSYFECAALLLNGFYLYLASIGDKEALNRIKVFFHVYDFQSVEDNKDDLIKVITFESLHHDEYNPYQCEYENKVMYRDEEYVPLKDRPWHWFEQLTDIAYEVCEPSEFDLPFEELIDNHIKGLAEKFITYQSTKNYKSRYYEGLEVHSMKDVYQVSSTDVDLSITFWNYLLYLLKNNIQTEIIHCERCGRIKIVKRKGRAKYCDNPKCRVYKSRNNYKHTYPEENLKYQNYLSVELPELLSKKKEEENENCLDFNGNEDLTSDAHSRTLFEVIKEFPMKLINAFSVK